jgi:hypothetical protein
MALQFLNAWTTTPMVLVFPPVYVHGPSSYQSESFGKPWLLYSLAVGSVAGNIVLRFFTWSSFSPSDPMMRSSKKKLCQKNVFESWRFSLRPPVANRSESMWTVEPFHVPVE